MKNLLTLIISKNSKKYHKKALVFVFITVLALFSVNERINANFSVQTAKKRDYQFNFEISGGKSIQDSIIVKNLNNEPAQLQLYGADGLLTRQGSFTLKTPDEKQINVGTWITFKDAEVVIPPQSEKEIFFTVSLPQQTPPGVYIGGIAVTSKKAQSTKSTIGLNVIDRVALKITVEVPGEKRHSFNWESFIHSLENDAHVFVLNFKNDGNTSIIAEGKVEIAGDTLKIEPVNLFRTDRFTMPVYWDKKPFYGDYKAKATVTFWEYDVKSGEKINPQTLTREINFTIIPWKVIYGGIIVVLLIIFFFLYRYFSWKKIMATCQSYSVTAQDTLVSIAQKFNVSWQLLAKINHLHPPYILQAGQTLLIPMKKNLESSSSNGLNNV